MRLTVRYCKATYIAASNLCMLSSDGRCHMWDASAEGYGRGEGVAVVFLKPLSTALADGDHIEGIIRATGVRCPFSVSKCKWEL